MFACLYSLSAPVPALVRVAGDFTPRFEVIGPLVMLDISGLSRLFGTPQDVGDQLRRAAAGLPIRIALAPTQTAAALAALGRAGVTVIQPEHLAATLASLPIDVLAELDRLMAMGADLSRSSAPDGDPHGAGPLQASRAPGPPGRGAHPRETHLAAHAFRARRGGLPRVRARACQVAIERLRDTLRRWGVRTLGELAALPPGEVYERLGGRGVRWQRLARGEDSSPLVPCVPEEPFDASLDLEWPLEGLEPLSFVLARLIEPLSARLERADRGAAVLHTHLRLIDRSVHARTLQLPAPMRDPKTLRTLVLLDLESHPPAAAVDRVRVLIEPTPARVTQWSLFERAQPSPEEVSTLLARLEALMGEGHVGSPRLVDSWRPGAFEMTPFAAASAAAGGASMPCVPRAADAVQARVNIAAGAASAPGAPPASGAMLASAEGRASSAVPVSDVEPISNGEPISGTVSTTRVIPTCRVGSADTGAAVALVSSREALSRAEAGCAAQPAPSTSRRDAHSRGDAHSRRDARTSVASPPIAAAVIDAPGTALRRFRLPIPVRVQVCDGRPARLTTDRRGVAGGAVVQAAGPWRTSGEWWHEGHARAWDRDEWDVALADGTVYRLFVEREVGHWFLDGVMD